MHGPAAIVSVEIKIYSRKAVPTAVATSLDIGLSNLSLKLITLSFYSALHFIYSFIQPFNTPISHVQIFVTDFRLDVCLLLQVGEILSSARGRHPTHLHWCPYDGCC